MMNANKRGFIYIWTLNTKMVIIVGSYNYINILKRLLLL